MNFPYLYTEQATDSLDIEDVGNTCLNALNDNADEWYLKIKSDLGWTVVEQFGPLTADSDSIGYSFTYTYYKFEFAETKLKKIISDFLNNPKRFITQAMIIEPEDFTKRLMNIKEGE